MKYEDMSIQENTNYMRHDVRSVFIATILFPDHQDIIHKMAYNILFRMFVTLKMFSYKRLLRG